VLDPEDDQTVQLLQQILSEVQKAKADLPARR
jgi:hypothetical protein